MLYKLYALFACLTFGLPGLIICEKTGSALIAWLLLVIFYLMLLRVFGFRFVLEGAIFTFLLSWVAAIWMMAAQKAETKNINVTYEIACPASKAAGGDY